MADTITTYIGNGTQTDFSIPFDYLKKSFVRVYVDSVLLTGGDYGDTTADYYFLDKTTVRFKTPPADRLEVTIRRYTSATERIVSFEDASILKATDLDTSQLQSFHIAEEARDVINDALVKDPDGNWDALGNRITNVGDPVDGGDAINLDWYNEGAVSVQANADLTEQWKNETKGYRDEAEGFRNESGQYASQAKTSADSAAGYASDIEETITQVKQDISTAATQVISQVSSTGSTAVSDINVAKDQATEHLETATQAHLSEITTASSTQVQAVNTAGTTQVGLVEAKGTAQVTRVEDAGSAQVDLVKDASEESLTSIASEGTKQVSAVSLEGTKQISAVNSAGQAQLATINASVQKAKDWAEKTGGEVEAGAYSAKYWAQQASTVAGQSDWAETNDSSPAFVKNKPDLSIYATKTELSSYATKSELTSGLASKADSSALASYATKSDLTSGLEGKADSSALASYATKTELNSYATLDAPSLTGNATLDGSPIATEADIPVLTSSTTDLKAGTSPLATGTYYFVYE